MGVLKATFPLLVFVPRPLEIMIDPPVTPLCDAVVRPAVTLTSEAVPETLFPTVKVIPPAVPSLAIPLFSNIDPLDPSVASPV